MAYETEQDITSETIVSSLRAISQHKYKYIRKAALGIKYSCQLRMNMNELRWTETSVFKRSLA